MTVDADAVSECVLQAFDLLPKKAKPITYSNGTQEWTPLSGVVVSYQASVDGVISLSRGCGNEADDKQLRCVALGTGMKCLPAAKIPLANGRCLHDWHAETIAIRAFNLFLMQECSDLSNGTISTSPIARFRAEGERTSTDFQPFAINDDVRIFMYCSEAPCGDASMELVMSSQDDATPWAVNHSGGTDAHVMKGRGFFSELGIVRRKPSRGDAPETLSKSCSDKLSMKECTSLLSSLTSLIIHPKNAYIHELVLPFAQYSPTATDRAFSHQGRMFPVTEIASQWQGGYSFRPFAISITSKEFPHSRRQVKQSGKLQGSNITAMWTPKKQEVLVGGTKAGFKQFSERGSSAISKIQMWSHAKGVSQRMHEGKGMNVVEILDSMEASNYAAVKASPLLDSRTQVKREVRKNALHMWVRNDGGDAFPNCRPNVNGDGTLM